MSGPSSCRPNIASTWALPSLKTSSLQGSFMAFVPGRPSQAVHDHPAPLVHDELQRPNEPEEPSDVHDQQEHLLTPIRRSCDPQDPAFPSRNPPLLVRERRVEEP